MFGLGRKAKKRFEHLADEGSIPSFPTAAANAIQQIGSPDVELSEVATSISDDPRLTVSVLKLANSPAFAPRSPITSVHQAVVLLGRNQLEALLIASGVRQAVPGDERAGYSPVRFWQTAAARASAAAAMAAVCDPSNEYRQFTAALLQDLAQPILLTHDDEYGRLVQAYGDCHDGLVAAEAQHLGWTHPEVGGLLCSQWGLPEPLTQAISLHHHEPVVGHEIAQWASLIEYPDVDVTALVEAAHRYLGVDEQTVRSVLDVAAERSGALAATFN